MVRKPSPRRAPRRPVQTVASYLASLPSEQRAALERLRTAIRGIVPAAEECISYQLPAFRLAGRMLVWYGAGSHHCAFYPGSVVSRFAAELRGFETSRGTIRFQPDHPIPVPLIRRIVRARLAERVTRG